MTVTFIPDVHAACGSGTGAIYDYIHDRGYATPSHLVGRLAIIRNENEAQQACQRLRQWGYLARTPTTGASDEWTYFPTDNPPLPTIQQIRVTN